METFFATCPRGLEPLLVEDLSAVGAGGVQKTAGGVQFRGDWSVCYRANLHSRIATRILWQVATGRYDDEGDIYRMALAVSWPRWFSPEATIRVDVTAQKSPLKSLEFLTLRIKDGICDRFRQDCGQRPSVDRRQPGVRLQGFVTADRCTLYVDTSGAPLYQRGLRQKSVDAPLKENLAAGILRLSGWRPGIPLLDPMCGGGTLLIEAAQLAHGIAAGARREFAFQRFRHFDGVLWRRLLDAARAAENEVGTANIFGSDHSPSAVRAAMANLDRCGLLPGVDLQVADVLERDAPAAAGILLTNPPYGERVANSDAMASFYPLLASVLKRRFAGWTCCLLSADTRLPVLMRLAPRRRTPLFNGALECRLYDFRMVAGSNRGAPEKVT